MALKVLHININGLRNKISLLMQYLKDYDIDIASLNETRVKPTTPLHISGYTIYRKDRSSRGGGGVAILIKESIVNDPIYYSEDIEAIGTSVQTKRGPITILSIYLPPGTTMPENFLNVQNSIHPNLIVTGDFNAHHLYFGSSKTTSYGEKLFSQVEESDLHQINNGEYEHTFVQYRNNRLISDLIDMAFTTKYMLNRVSEYTIQHDLTSDHVPITFKIDSAPIMTAPRSFTSFAKTDWSAYRNFIETTIPNQKDLNSTDYIDQEVNAITDTINRAAARFSTVKIVNNQQWTCTPTTLALIREKRKARRKLQRSPENHYLKWNYNYLKNRVRTAISIEKQNEFRQRCNRINSNPRRFWYNAKKILGLDQRPLDAPFLINPTGTQISDDKGKASIFAEHLAKCHQIHCGAHFDQTNFNIVSSYVNTNMIRFKPRPIIEEEEGDDSPLLNRITEEEVSSMIKKAKKNSSPGKDGISYKLLKQNPRSLNNRIAKLFNSCLMIGYFPSLWKGALGIMIPKPRKNHTDPSNYRPISLLPCLGKILEKVICSRLSNYLELTNYYNKWQRGFRKGMDTNLHTHRLIQHGKLAIKRGIMIGAVFIDCEKAFDSIWHDGLRYKLSSLHLPIKLTRFLSSFLNDRSIAVRIKDSVSPSVLLKAGTPQGAILSPLLFNIYVNDIPINPLNQVNISQFADDIGIWFAHKSPKLVELRLQKTIDEDILPYCSKWRIKLNPNKTQVFLGYRKSRSYNSNIAFNLSMHGVKLQLSEYPTFLGFKLDRLFNLSKHIEEKTADAARRLMLLARLRGTDWGADTQSLMKLYKSLIRPLFEFGAIDLIDAKPTSLQKLQVIQNKALRLALHQPYYTTINALHSLYRIDKIKDRLKNLQQKSVLRYSDSVLYIELQNSLSVFQRHDRGN